MFEFFIEISHFAIDFDTDDMVTDFGMEAIGEVEGQGTLRQINNIALRSIDKNFIGKEIQNTRNAG